MKIWLKYLIAIAVGILSAFFIPSDNAAVMGALNFIVEMVIRFGRYLIVPLLFFSIAYACYNLRNENLIGKTALWTFGSILLSSFGLMLLGLVSILIFKIPRLPINFEKVTDIPNFNWKDLLTNLFPYSGFEALLNGSYLLPCFIFAGFVGSACSTNKIASKPAVTLFDSLSKVFYVAVSFFTEVLTFGMIFIMARWSVSFVSVFATKTYNILFLMLLLLLLIIAFVIYPLVLRFVCHEHHPYKVMYACISPFLAGFLSGDTNFALTLSLRHGKESLGIRRRTNSITYPLFAIFGRGGSAMVQAICFILILRSYSSLAISFADIAWIGFISFILSFSLMQFPAGGPFIAITIMCSMYGKNFEEGYLLLKAASPIICSFAAGIDTLTATVGSYIVAVKCKTVIHQDIKKFI